MANLYRGWIGSSFHHIMIEYDNINEYYEKMEEEIEKEIKRFEIKYESEWKSLTDPDDRVQFEDFYTDDVDKFYNFFPNTLRQSILLTVQQKFESALYATCNAVNEYKHIGKVFKPSLKNGLDKAIEYLEKDAKISLSKGTDIWARLTAYRDLRNLIIHNDGNVRFATKNIKSFIKRNSKFITIISGKIFLTNKIIGQSIQDYKKFYKNLYTAV